MATRDPIQRAASRGRDLYDVATWEPRTALDRVAVRLYHALLTGGRVAVVVFATLLVASQVALSVVAFAEQPVVATYVAFSVVPALALAAFVYRLDVTSAEPVGPLVGTFLLGFVFAGFAALLNTVFQGGFEALGVPLIVFFFLVVGPVEESVKLLAVRLLAARTDAFDAVVDGAVYGAMAGLGFATVENTAYITAQYVTAAGPVAALDQALWIATLRTFAGPGHVLFSAYAGYYLGLATFNPDRAGPIVVRGLLVATLVHATYNAVVTDIGGLAALVGLGGVNEAWLFVAFVVAFDGAFGYVLYRKLTAYRRAYYDTGADRLDAPVETVDREEFVRDRT